MSEHLQLLSRELNYTISQCDMITNKLEPLVLYIAKTRWSPYIVCHNYISNLPVCVELSLFAYMLTLTMIRLLVLFTGNIRPQWGNQR